tara:strand:+ start:1004 stop:1843 length:840 start_codon:yes stop_codon:yes gene_type:complete
VQKPLLPYVESMLVYPCNLKCDGCSTFSDLTVQGYVAADQGIAWLQQWAERFEIQAWGAMGGEPLMNPQMYDWIVAVRQLLPDAQIRFVTNGLLLERHWRIVELLNQIGNCILKITVHLSDKRIQSAIDRIQRSYDWEPVYEYGIHRHSLPNGMKFQVNKPKWFTQTFQNTYADMLPWDSNPVEAFDNCHQQTCSMLLEDKLYKCSNTALIPGVWKKHNQPNADAWKPYIDTGLSVDASLRELQAFSNNVGKPHAVCQQCPTKNDSASWIDHTNTVEFK